MESNRRKTTQKNNKTDHEASKRRPVMKIQSVSFNNRKKAFELSLHGNVLSLPFSRLRLKPSAADPIQEAWVDHEVGAQAFTYRLASGKEDTIHLDQVLEYNRDPDYLRKMLLYRLTIQAQKLLATKKVAKREIIRRLGTSPTQFYRLIDQTNTNKTIDQMIRLLSALDCTVEFIVSDAA
jgi:hypothetical protein